jgi:hypothetical protein
MELWAMTVFLRTGSGEPFELILILTLLALLSLAELSSPQGNHSTSMLRRVFSMGILPLLMAFALIVVIAIIGIVE